MSGATPDVVGDLVAKLAALAALDNTGPAAMFPASAIFVDQEDAPGGAVAEQGLWVKFKRETREDYDFDGAIRYQTFELKARADLNPADPKAQKTRANLMKLCDAINKLGAWTGASGAHYMDALVEVFPMPKGENYVIADVTVSFDTPSTV